ncbi:MAG: ABC transporter ATP-binding protein [Bdellovibrio sp.]|nr:ABC transporter ATP-binding protein [Bdellovibrio sp.]
MIDQNIRKEIKDFLGPQVIRWMFTGIIAGISVSAVELAIAYGIQAFLLALGLMKENVIKLPTWIPVQSLKAVLIFIVALAALRSILYFFQVYVPNATYNAFGFRQRQRLVEWSFSSAIVNTPFVSTLYTERVTLSSSFINGVQYIIIYGCTSILITAALFFLSPVLSLVAFCLMAVFLMPIYFFNTRIRNESVKFAESWEQANRRLLVGLKNIFLIRIYGAEQKEVEKSKSSLAVYSKSHTVIYKLGAFKFALPQFVGVLIICLTVYIGQNYFAVEAGILVSFLYLFFRWVQNLSFIYLNAGQVVHYRPQINELFAWHLNQFAPYRDAQAPELNGSGAELKKFKSPIGWNAKGLNFSYTGREAVLRNLSFTIEPSSIVLIKGPSGSGKTTLIGLLLSQLPTGLNLNVFEKGQIPKDMEAAKNYLMTSVGYAGPEPFVIEGTVRENLLYANHETVSEAAIEDALKIADCDFLNQVTDRLDFKMTEQGQGLSTGQKQRISLARAILRNPKALFLDEALSNVDQETRHRILTNLFQVKERFTLIFISHFEFESLKPDLEISFQGSGPVQVTIRN